MHLNEKQFQEVYDYLLTTKRSANNSFDELIDHFCCNVEQGVRAGSSFEEAFAQTQLCWSEDEVQKLNSSNQKRSTMIKTLSLLSCVLALLTFSPMTESQAEASSPEFPVEARIDPPASCPLRDDFGETVGFGKFWHPINKKEAFHRGIDWRAPMGTPVHAAGDGVVLVAESHEKYGLRIIIAHDEIYQTLYAHLSTLRVSKGDSITVGQWIGDVGSTGLSTGPHLHYEVIKNGVAVDPKQYLP